MITQDYLKHFLDYNSNTGVFTWKINRTKNTKAGDVAGYNMPDGYIRITLGGIKYKAHRLAWLYVNGVMPELMIDHINGNPSDNRIQNLRLATDNQNQYNKKISINNTSGIKGVSFHKPSKRWQASIRINGKRLHLGYFDDIKIAESIIIDARIKYHNEFARNE